MAVRVLHGDMREQLQALIAEGVRVQSVVTDPPYHLTTGKNGGTGVASLNLDSPAGRARISTGFMGKAWDGGDIAFRPGTWRLCCELLPPGGHLLAFAGTRTHHRMACAIEDAGFELRDTIAWLYGSGFPKSHNVSKGIDRAAGAEREPDEYTGPNGLNSVYGDNMGGGITTRRGEPATDAARQWDGWGTALKPAMELICVARKPLTGTVAANVLAHGTGALNIDGCRIATGEDLNGGRYSDDKLGDDGNTYGSGINLRSKSDYAQSSGRWPANVVHDGSAGVVRAFPDSDHARGNIGDSKGGGGMFGHGPTLNGFGAGDEGSAARFFYSAKADSDDRLGSRHPTVKPVDLMRWLVRLVTPPNGTVLDPFAGSGTTGMACMAEGFDAILIEREAEYVADIRARIAHVRGEDTPLFASLEKC